MSMLDRTQTPLSLFLDHDLEPLVTLTNVIEDHTSQTTSPVSGHDCVPVFRERANLERAGNVLCDVGILRPSADNTKFIGVMHQLVQRCVRDQLVYRSRGGNSMYGSTHTVINVVRKMLRQQMYYERSPHIKRDVAPCVEAWCDVVLPTITRSPNASRITVHENDVRMLGDLGFFLRNLQGDAQNALTIHERVCVIVGDILPQDHPHIAISMHNLATTFSNLGRHDDALKLHQEALEFRKRVLPRDHPGIAKSMNDLAITFSNLGRLNDALELQQEVLKFEKRVLPRDHPNIATSMSNLALTFSNLGRHDDALKLQQQVLEFRKRVLPSGHPDIATSTSNLGKVLFAVGNFEQGLTHIQTAIEIH